MFMDFSGVSPMISVGQTMVIGVSPWGRQDAKTQKLVFPSARGHLKCQIRLAVWQGQGMFWSMRDIELGLSGNGASV